MFYGFNKTAFAFMLLVISFSISAQSKDTKMSGPAQNGVLIYSSDLDRLSKFYEQLFGMHITRKTPDFISLDKDGFNLIIHVPPFEMSKVSFSAIKLFLSVENMEKTRKKAIELGGKAFEGEWANPIFKVSNIADSEGNHIQIRESKNAGKGS